jgi:hypothetical protein
LSLSDITASLQHSVTEACAKLRANPSSEIASIELGKGDYAIQMLQIPRNGRVVLSSKERVRLVYAGKRNRPMFVLEENSLLVLREKIEIYYNTNNVQEVTKLMIRLPSSSRIEVSKEVKIQLFSQKQE